MNIKFPSAASPLQRVVDSAAPCTPSHPDRTLRPLEEVRSRSVCFQLSSCSSFDKSNSSTREYRDAFAFGAKDE